jgi:hypothetical protein
MHPRAPDDAVRGHARANGMAVLLAIVVVGLATGAGFYRWKRSEQDARLAVEIAAAPRTPEERLALWLELSGPQLHHRLAVVGRFTSDMPWLVTHAVAAAEGPPELWGVDCGDLSKDLAHREGMKIVVALPHPRVLGRATLEGERKNRVPLYAAAVQPDASARLSELALALLEGIPHALERDIPGASLEDPRGARVAGRARATGKLFRRPTGARPSE